MEPKQRLTHRRILGVIAIVWGAAVLLYHFFGAAPARNVAYAGGQGAATLFSVVLILVGIYYVAKG